MGTPKEPWVPEGPEAWAEVFANGIGLDRSRREEAEAKANAAKTAQGGGNGDGGTDGGDAKPRSLAERILGIGK